MVLRDRPYRDPGRLLWVWQCDRTRSGSWLPVSAPNFVDWQRQATSFEQLAAFFQSSPDLEHTGPDPAPAERLPAGEVTVNLLSTVGVKPLLGRVFLPGDERSRVVLLSHSLWQARFNSDPQIINQVLRFSGEDYSVIGVMPAGFHFPPEPEPDQLWFPLPLDGEQVAEAKREHRRLYVLGRLKRGVTMK